MVTHATWRATAVTHPRIEGVETKALRPDEYRLEAHDTLPYDWTRKDG